MRKTVAILVDSTQVPLSTKIIRSVVFGGLRYVVIAPIPFMMTPLILHRIGVAGFGTWAVFLAINSLTSLADLGLVGTVSKFVAEHNARRDIAALSNLINSGIALFLIIGTVIGIAMFVLSDRLASSLFRGASLPSAEVVFLVRCFVIVVVVNMLNQLFASVTAGLQRLDLTNVISTINILLSAVFGALLLLKGFGLLGLVCAYIGSGWITFFIYVVTVRRLLPEVALNPLYCDVSEAKRMFSYSLRLYVTQAAVVVHNQMEKILLATLVGVSAAGWYDIASDVALKIRGAIAFILNPMLAAASELNALGDLSRMKELYYRAHKYLALCGIPLLCFAVSVSNRFVELWLGPSMKMVAMPLAILLVANFVNVATGPGFFILAGIGYMRPGIQAALVGLALNLVLSVALIHRFGFAGAVVGTAGALILAAFYFIAVFHRHTGYLLGKTLKGYLKPAICSTTVLVGVSLIFPQRNLSWVGLASRGVIFAMFYLMAIVFSRFFDEYDWAKLEVLVPAFRYARALAGSSVPDG